MRRALELALEWIEKQPEETPDSKYDVDTRYVVIKEIEAALAQPEQEGGVCGRCGGWVSDPVITQPEQEPVAWRYRGNLHEFDPNDWAEGEVTPLYTSPPQRTWVGLTEEDLKLLSAEWRIVYGAWVDDFARDIEAKLKEKNT